MSEVGAVSQSSHTHSSKSHALKLHIKAPSRTKRSPSFITQLIAPPDSASRPSQLASGCLRALGVQWLPNFRAYVLPCVSTFSQRPGWSWLKKPLSPTQSHTLCLARSKGAPLCCVWARVQVAGQTQSHHPDAHPKRMEAAAPPLWTGPHSIPFNPTHSGD